MQKTELFYLNETIKATDALQNGLVTKIINSDVFESEIVHQTEQIAQQSSQVCLNHFLFVEMIHSRMDKPYRCKTVDAFFHSMDLLN